MNVYIGTSGFSYDDWIGVFYPETLQQGEWLKYYSQYFNTTELNITFYRIPLKKVFSSWYNKADAKFLFAVKGSRYITHIKRLNDVHDACEHFFSRVLLLKEKLGVILWQLPPFLNPDVKIFYKFLKLISKYKIRHAFEFRNKAWTNDESIIKLITQAGASVCISDWRDQPTSFIPGFNFYYIRKHGPKNAPLYSGLYTSKQVLADAKLIQANMKDKDVFIYYNNDVSGYAIKNAFMLQQYLGYKISENGVRS